MLGMQHQLISYLPSKQIVDATVTRIGPLCNSICLLWHRKFNTVLVELGTLDINYFYFIDILIASACIDMQKNVDKIRKARYADLV